MTAIHGRAEFYIWQLQIGPLCFDLNMPFKSLTVQIVTSQRALCLRVRERKCRRFVGEGTITVRVAGLSSQSKTKD